MQRALDQPVGNGERRVDPIGRDGEIEIAARHHRQRVPRLHLQQLDRELRMRGCERRQRRRHQAARGRGNRRQRQLPDDRAAMGLDVGLGLGHDRHDAIGVLDQQHRRVGEAHAAPVALDQPLPQLRLQLADLLRHRRGRHRQHLRGRAHRPVGGDGVKHAQPLEIQHASNTT